MASNLKNSSMRVETMQCRRSRERRCWARD